MTLQLNEKSALILDYVLNVPSVVNYDELLGFVGMITSASNEEIKSEWDSLVKIEILVERDYKLVISPTSIEDVKSGLAEHLSLSNINADTTRKHVESETSDEPEKRREYVSLLGKFNLKEEAKHLIFSDHEWVNEPGVLCDELVRLRVMFMQGFSSRKHDYRSYYLRSWPFDAYEMLSNVILKSLRIEHLSDVEWSLVFQLLFSSGTSLPYDVLKSNMSITEAELRECITNLKEKGHLVEQNNAVGLVRGVYPSVLQYFAQSVYPRFKDEIVSKIKRRVTEGLSNLYPFMCAKRLNELPIGESRSDVIKIKTIKKSEAGPSKQIPDLTRLGLALDSDENIVLLVDVIKEVENWVKGSLKSSIMLIPADNPFLADSMLKSIFADCDNYAKIQDPYLGEDTFRILTSYASKDLDILLLTGQIIGQGESFEDVCRDIERLKSDRRGKFQIQFIAGRGGGHPFTTGS